MGIIYSYFFPSEEAGGDPTSVKVEEPATIKLEEPASRKVEEPTIKVEERASVKVEEPASVKVEEPASVKVVEQASVKVDTPVMEVCGGFRLENPATDDGKIESQDQGAVEQDYELVDVSPPESVDVSPPESGFESGFEVVTDKAEEREGVTVVGGAVGEATESVGGEGEGEEGDTSLASLRSGVESLLTELSLSGDTVKEVSSSFLTEKVETVTVRESSSSFLTEELKAATVTETSRGGAEKEVETLGEILEDETKDSGGQLSTQF